MRILLLITWFLIHWSFTANTSVFAQAPSAQAEQAPVAEREIFIHIHSGLKTMPVRKVIGVIIGKAEERGVKEIVGHGKHVEWDVWDITLTLLKGKETKELKWRYGRESWNIQPMNETARGYSFPLDKYVMGPAINIALGAIEGQGVNAEEISGKGEKLQDGRWQFLLKAIDPKEGTYIQKWLYDPKSGELIPQQFDHSDLDKVLAVCVTDRGVNYPVLKKNADLEEFLKKASWVDKKELEALPREERVAFWINLYNATVLKRVANRYPIKSVKEIKGFFDKEKIKLAGRSLTLNDIRGSLVGKDYQEGRALFALVSGTRSSPPLRKEAYCGRLLESQLEEDLKSFLNHPANLYATEAGILISPILEPITGGKDKSQPVRDFLRKFSSSLPPAVSKALMDEKKEIKFIEYDWGLNTGE